jgi:hypothetical protein
MTVPTKKNRAQRQQTSGGAGSRTGPLPTVPEQDPLAGTNAFTSGRGYVLAPPSVDSLMAALKLFDDGGAAAQAPAAAAILPTGSTWPVLAIVTPEGLQTHAVEPSMGAAADSRGAWACLQLTTAMFDRLLLPLLGFMALAPEPNCGAA